MLSKFVAAAGALALTCAYATAEDAKPNDAQIAHIAIQRDRSTSTQPNSLCGSPRTRRFATSLKTWCAITKRSTIRPWP